MLVIHCMIHRETHAFRSLPKDLIFVLYQVITVANLMKSRPLASRIFSQFFETMNLDYKGLLYHTNVCWLSRGKLLKRVVQLKAKVILFLEAEKKTLDFVFMTKSRG